MQNFYTATFQVFTVAHRKHATDRVYRLTPGFCWGPVHTYPDIFESATFSFRIRLSSTRIRQIQMRIRNFLHPLSGVEFFESANNLEPCGRANPDIFESDEVAKFLFGFCPECDKSK